MLPAEDAHEGSSLRDPLEVVEDFDHRLPSDQIDGSIAIKFSDFVLQRLAGIAFDAPADQRSVYLHFTLDDRNFSVNVARELKKVGFAPLLRPISPESTTEELAFAEGTLLSRVRTAIVCWGSATHAAIISELGNPALRKWKNIMPVHRKVTLFLGPPCCPPKTEMLEFGIGGDADVVVAGYAAEALSDAVKTDLVPRLNG